MTLTPLQQMKKDLYGVHYTVPGKEQLKKHSDNLKERLDKGTISVKTYNKAVSMLPDGKELILPDDKEKSAKNTFMIKIGLGAIAVYILIKVAKK